MEIYILVIAALTALGIFVEAGKTGRWSGTLAVAGHRPVWSVNLCFWLLIAALLILFGGLRYRVGDDFDSYCLIFENICKDWDTILYNGTEAGYVWLNRLVSVWTEEPQWIIVVTTAMITVFGVIAICKESKLVPFSLFIFFTTIYYQGFNLIRQCIACSMVLLALVYVKRKRWMWACVWLFLASLFHKTALVGFPVLFLAHFRYQPLNGLLLRIYPTAAATSASYLYEGVSGVQVVLCLLYAGLCLRYYRPMLEKSPGNIVYMNLYIFLLGVYAFFYWIPMWGRMQLYFIGMYALIVPEAIACEKNRVLRILYYAVIWGILLFFFIVPKLSGDLGAWEYQTILSQI